MSTKMLTGSFVALITPFNRDGSMDFAAFRTLLKFQQDRGTSAVLIMGSIGLVVSRRDTLRSEHHLDSLLSREAIFLGNNLVFVARSEEHTSEL